MATADDSYIILTPSGVLEAFSQSEPTSEQKSLQRLLASRISMSINEWVDEYSYEWLEDFEEKGWIEPLDKPLPAPTVPLDQFLPYVVASLSGNRRAAIGSDEGFCLARIGYSQDEAEMLCVAAADFLDFVTRQNQRGLQIGGQAFSFFDHVDLLIPTTSFVFLWIDGQGHALIIDGEPATNNRALVELIWGIKTAGLRFNKDA